MKQNYPTIPLGQISANVARVTDMDGKFQTHCGYVYFPIEARFAVNEAKLTPPGGISYTFANPKTGKMCYGFDTVEPDYFVVEMALLRLALQIADMVLGKVGHESE